MNEPGAVKLKVFKVKRPDFGGKYCVYLDWKEVQAEFDGAEIGEQIFVELAEMTREEFDNLGDFEGW